MIAVDVTAPAGCQRWREQRESYRPAGEPLETVKYGVEVVDETAARPFVMRHHYSGSYPAARLAVGLFRARAWFVPELVGVAVFSVPMSQAVVPKWLDVAPTEGVELGRLVLLDDVAANGESWFVARAFRAARRELAGVRGVVMFSDPVRRVVPGRTVLPGHVGTIYQALSASYRGRTNAATKLFDSAGHEVSNRLLSKIRGDETGRDYAERELVRRGAAMRRPGESGAAWVERILEGDTFQRVRHPGCHGYVWRFDGVKVARGEYPKRMEAA